MTLNEKTNRKDICSKKKVQVESCITLLGTMCVDCAGFSVNRKPRVRTFMNILNDATLINGSSYGKDRTHCQSSLYLNVIVACNYCLSS